MEFITEKELDFLNDDPHRSVWLKNINRMRQTANISPNEIVNLMLLKIGEDLDRDGLRETPSRVIKSWRELYSGYEVKDEDISTILKVFEMDSDEMVVLKEIEFFSNCEHHMQPFFGVAHIGYLPNGKVVGISKLARLVEVYSRRLQIQERLGLQIARAIETHLDCRGCGVVLEAKHFCMTSRGVNKQNSVMTTSAMLGAFREDAKVRDEFLRMIGK